MTQTEVTGRIIRNLNDNNVFYTSEDTKDSIQDGYDEIAAFSGCIIKATTLNWQSGLVYYDFADLISDFTAVTAIFNTNTKRWMFPTSCRSLNEIRFDWEMAIGNPLLFWPVNFRYVAFFPHLTNATGSMYVYYRAKADLLDSNSEINIPTEHLDTIELYSTSDLLEQTEEFTKASLNFKEYLKTLDSLRKAKRQFQYPDKISGLMG